MPNLGQAVSPIVPGRDVGRSGNALVTQQKSNDMRWRAESAGAGRTGRVQVMEAEFDPGGGAFR